jgi:uncharacterized membrane protein YdjX (TVP38/TMEM64 family)
MTATNHVRHRVPALHTLGGVPGPLPTVRAALRRPRGSVVRFALLVALVAGLGAMTLSIGPDRDALLHVISGSSVFAPVVAVVGSTVLIAALVPRTLLAFAGGALFGTVPGCLYVLAGVTAGALIAYLIGRLLGREFVMRRLGGRLAMIESAVSKRGIGAVIISRMIPIVPFGISNYTFGTTTVRTRHFALGTMLGVIPANVAYAALGAATMHGDLSDARIAGACVACLGIGGSVGTYLIWRRRPRKQAALETPPQPALALAGAEK